MSGQQQQSNVQHYVNIQAMQPSASPMYVCYTPNAMQYYTTVYDHAIDEPTISGLHDSGYFSNPSHTPQQETQQSRQHYGTKIHYTTTPKNRNVRPAEKHCSPFQLTNPHGAIEYRFNCHNLALLPRGAFIEMGSPEAQAAIAPKWRRLLGEHNAAQTGSSMEKSVVEKRPAQRGLNMDQQFNNKENKLTHHSQSQPAVLYSETQNAPTDFISLTQTCSTSMPASAPPMPQPDVINSPVHQSTSKANVTRTPTPFKKAMEDVKRKRGRLLNFDHVESTPMHQVAQDLKEILQSDDLNEIDNNTTSPSKFIGNDLMLGGEYLRTNASPVKSLASNFDIDDSAPSFASNAALTCIHPFDVTSIQLPAVVEIPSVQPTPLCDRWMQIACGRTPIQLDLTVKARRLLKAYRKRKRVLVKLDDEQL